MNNRRCKVYDHRIKEKVVRSRNRNLFLEMHIPPSTARSWIQRGLGEVVSLRPDTAGEDVLHDRIATLERRVRILSAVLRLKTLLLRVSGCRLEWHRLPDSRAKLTLHAAFDGQTPDEIYFGRAEGVPEQLGRRCHKARQKRLERNLAATCSSCPRTSQEELAA